MTRAARTGTRALRLAAPESQPWPHGATAGAGSLRTKAAAAAAAAAAAVTAAADGGGVRAFTTPQTPSETRRFLRGSVSWAFRVV